MSPSSPHHLIQGDGTFGMDSSGAFAAACTPPLSSVGLQYSAVAIMGPQSSGKSTLLNKVFGTSFVEMDAQVGRSQTTKGVWVSKSPRITDSNATVLVLDLEGSDRRERGEDDTNFEKQSALFALSPSRTSFSSTSGATILDENTDQANRSCAPSCRST